jgi:putative ABC transport system permease protein
MFSKLAIRNLLKNKTRTFLSILMISGALISMVLFRGYVLKTLEMIEVSIINGQYGHMQIGKIKYWDQTSENRATSMIENPEKLESEIEQQPGIDFVSQRLTFFGLISTPNVSESGYFIGINVKKEKYFNQGAEILEGTNINPQENGTVIVGNLLAKRLKLKVGDEVTIVANTLDNVINAFDFKVVGIFATGTEEFDRLSCFIQIADAKKVLQTSNAENIRISIKSNNQILSIMDGLNKSYLKDDLKVRAWYEISDLFRKVEIFYNTQTGIMYLILLFIISLGITNTISMSLNERIGEIGTLRAIGQSQVSLFFQFLIEASYLCLIGLVIGIVLSVLLIYAINAAKIATEIPGASVPILIEIGLYWDSIALISVIICAVVLLMTCLLINKYVRMNIVESLRYNI